MTKKHSRNNRLGAALHSWPLRHTHTVGFALLGMTLGLVVVLVGRYGTNIHQASSPLRVLSQAQVATNSAYEMKLSNTHTIDGKDPAFGLDPGRKFLVTTLSVTNKSNETIKLWPSTQTYVRDTEGGSFVMHPTTTIIKPYLAGEIEPGQTVTGELSYDVPVDVTNARLFIDPGWNSMQPVVFALTK